jgi:ABC-2 type transport system ATP-binding protein
MDTASIQRRSDELLKLVGLSGRDRESVRQFSKGMYQRLGLAQALMHDPDLLFLDEPTDGLDPVGRNEVRKVIDRLRGLGKTIFLNSHILQEVELVCTRVAIMAKGKILASGSMGSAASNPEDGLNERLIGQQDQGGPVTFDLIAPNQNLGLESFFKPLQQATVSVQSLTSSAATHRVVATPNAESLITQPELDAIVDKLRDGNVSIARLDTHVPTLEDTFMRLVQSANQDPAGLKDKPAEVQR